MGEKPHTYTHTQLTIEKMMNFGREFLRQIYFKKFFLLYNWLNLYLYLQKERKKSEWKDISFFLPLFPMEKNGYTTWNFSCFSFPSHFYNSQFIQHTHTTIHKQMQSIFTIGEMSQISLFLLPPLLRTRVVMCRTVAVEELKRRVLQTTFCAIR